MHETCVFNIDEVAAAGSLDFHRSRVVAACLAELAILDANIEFEGVIPTSMERGVLWQRYGQLCADIGSRAFGAESRLYHPCQKDIVLAAGNHIGAFISEEQNKRMGDLSNIAPKAAVTSLENYRLDTDRITWRFRRDWRDISPSERYAPVMLTRLASELLLTSTLYELRNERAALLKPYEESVTA